MMRGKQEIESKRGKLFPNKPGTKRVLKNPEWGRKQPVQPAACSTPNGKPSGMQARPQPYEYNGVAENSPRKQLRFKTVPSNPSMSHTVHQKTAKNQTSTTSIATTKQTQRSAATDTSPPPPPPFFHPYYHPYGFPFLPPYPFPYYPHPFNWQQGPMGVEEHIPLTAKSHRGQMEALDLATLHQKHYQFQRDVLNHPADYYHRYYMNLFPKIQAHGPSLEDKDFPKPPSVLRHDEVKTPTLPVSSLPKHDETQADDGTRKACLETVNDLLCGMLKSCEKNVHKMQTECGEPHVAVQLSELKQSLRHCKEQVSQQCQALAASQKLDKLTEPSVADLLAQVQELQREKVGLVERIKESCTAYSEVKLMLHGLEKTKEEQDKELEEKRQKTLYLQTELEAVTKNLTQTVDSLKSVKEELTIAKGEHSTGLELKAKNAVLQQQANSLYKELSETKEDNLKLVEQVNKLKHSLIVSREQEQMMKVTLEGKNQQLLQVEDQFLGLRQCLACFLSKINASRNSVQMPEVDSSYSVPADAVQRLKSLADNGNIMGYLSSYTDKSVNQMARTPESELFTLSGQDMLLDSSSSVQMKVITPVCFTSSNSVDESSTLMGSYSTTPSCKRAHSHKQFHKRKAQSSVGTTSEMNSSVGVKSSRTTASEMDFRNDLASLDANIERLQTQLKVALQPSQ